MLRSMTGFGRAEEEIASGRLQVEARSVNHRYLKLNTRVPDEFSPYSLKLDQLIKEHLARGSVSVDIRFFPRVPEHRIDLDKVALKRLVTRVKEEASNLGLQPPTGIEPFLGISGIVISETRHEVVDESEWEEVREVVVEALEKLVASREAEGAAIGKDIRGHIETISVALDPIREEGPGLVAQYRDRFLARMESLLAESSAEVPEEDLVREAATYADKTDIAEEIQRLEGHVESMTQTLDAGGKAGRKLDFVAQEMLREANTMLSKSQDSDLIQEVLDVKLAIDQIREQIQNLE